MFLDVLTSLAHLLPECDLHLGLEDQHHAVDESLTGQLWRLSMPDPVSAIIAVPAFARDGLQYVRIEQLRLEQHMDAQQACCGQGLRGVQRDEPPEVSVRLSL